MVFQNVEQKMPYLQKNKKYGAVVSMTKTATTSSISVRQENLSTGISSMSTQEHRNMTREGAVICTG
jgi:hypothetical protein